MKPSKACCDLVAEFEGCKLHAYRCPAGKWTIGYGWTNGVHEGDKWTQEYADMMLSVGLEPYAKAVEHACPEATQNEFDAMVSLCYNIGPTNFSHSSVARYHLRREHKNAADAFLMWDKSAGRVLPGLTRRRKAERDLYLGIVREKEPVVEPESPPVMAKIAPKKVHKNA